MQLLAIELRLLAWLAVAWIAAVLVMTGARYGFAPALAVGGVRGWWRWRRRRRRALEEVTTCL